MSDCLLLFYKRGPARQIMSTKYSHIQQVRVNGKWPNVIKKAEIYQ